LEGWGTFLGKKVDEVAETGSGTYAACFAYLEEMDIPE